MRELTNRAEITRGSNRALLFYRGTRGHISVRWMNPMRPCVCAMAHVPCRPSPPSQPPEPGYLWGGWEGGVGRQGHHYWMNPMRPSFVGLVIPNLYSSLPDKPPKGGADPVIQGGALCGLPGLRPAMAIRERQKPQLFSIHEQSISDYPNCFQTRAPAYFPQTQTKPFWRYGP